MQANDNLGRKLAQYNVAGFVPDFAFACGIPNDLRNGVGGMIPSVAMMRIVIAKVLSNHGKI